MDPPAVTSVVELEADDRRHGVDHLHCAHSVVLGVVTLLAIASAVVLVVGMVCDIVCAGLLDVDVVDAIVAIGVAHFGERAVGILGLLCADLEAWVALRVEAAVVGALG